VLVTKEFHFNVVPSQLLHQGGHQHGRPPCLDLERVAVAVRSRNLHAAEAIGLGATVGCLGSLGMTITVPI
jgi:hypothetical protein